MNIITESDDLLDNGHEKRKKKLLTHDGILLKLPTSCELSNYVSIFPSVTLYDMFGNLGKSDEIDDKTLRYYDKMEWFSYLIDVQVG